MGCKIYLGIVSIILFGIILIGLVSAGTCSEDQRIMRLFDLSINGNSHGAVYNNNLYTPNKDVCFSDIYGFTYTGSNDHSCHGTNKLINLFQTNNSHAQIPNPGAGIPIYTYSVCFGELDCRVVSTSAECVDSQGEKVVLSLYNKTNSHIAFGDKAGYNYKICCKAFNVNSVNWTDMSNKPISNANLNDRVKLMVNGFGFKTKNFIFSVTKKGTGLFPSDRLVYGPLNVPGSTYSSVYATWRANVSGNYYFNVTTFDGKTYGSGILTVSEFERNSAPVANITNPIKGEIKNINNIIGFNQSSYDIDDFMNYSWDFDDLTIVKGSTVDYVNYNLTHSYSIAGQKNIKLSVIDERGATDQDLVSILIIDTSPGGNGKKYVFAGIRKPKYDETISAMGNVEFDARDSYAIQVTSISPLTIQCLGGNCPASIPGAVYTKSNDGVYTMFNFSWRFDDGTSSGIISGNPSYFKGLSIVDHLTLLEVSLSPVEKSNTFVMFKYQGGGSEKCQSNKTEWVDGGMVYKTFDPISWCNGTDKIPGNADDCCPDSYTCQSGGAGFKCQVNAKCTPVRYSCGEYKDSTNCTNDKINNCNVADKSCTSSSSGGNICGELSSGGIVGGSCNCFWNASAAGGVGACQFNGTASINIGGTVALEGTCVVDPISQSECNEGQMIVTQNSNMKWNQTSLDSLSLYLKSKHDPLNETPKIWIQENCDLGDLCFSGPRPMFCEDDSIRLDFFNWFNAFIAVMIIAIVYFIWFRIDKK